MDFHSIGDSLDFDKGFSLRFDLKTGKSADMDTGKRRLSGMRGMFADAEAERALIEQSDPLIYEFHSLPAPSRSGDLAFGCSIVYPGKVGDEYYMTKGHFHTILETAEVYYCLSGEGYMMMENPEGDWQCLEMRAGKAVYVPGRYAHRSICVGRDEPLVTFFVFRADAGHNYGTIEEKGYRKLLVERDGKPTVIDNPKWQVER